MRAKEGDLNSLTVVNVNISIWIGWVRGVFDTTLKHSYGIGYPPPPNKGCNFKEASA